MKKVLAAVAIVLLCSGCALTTEQIDVPYQPATVAAPVPGAPDASVQVTGTDGRTTYRDRVSSKKNGYGMEMAAIIAKRDVPASVTDAFVQELSARGFKMGAGGSTVQVEVVRFYGDFKSGFFSGDAVANIAFNVKVMSSDARIAFSKYYEGTGVAPNIQLATGSNARDALIKAFTASVNSAVNDPDFINAVLASGGQVAMLHPGS